MLIALLLIFYFVDVSPGIVVFTCLVVFLRLVISSTYLVVLFHSVFILFNFSLLFQKLGIFKAGYFFCETLICLEIFFKNISFILSRPITRVFYAYQQKLKHQDQKN